MLLAISKPSQSDSCPELTLRQTSTSSELGKAVKIGNQIPDLHVVINAVTKTTAGSASDGGLAGVH